MKEKYSINNFRLATIEEVTKYCAGHAILKHPKNITPYYVYRFLKEKYGAPNFPSEWHGDTYRVSWEYVLKGPRTFIAIHDWKIFPWSFSIRLPVSTDQLTNGHVTRYDDDARKDAKIVLIEIIGGYTGISILKPPDIISVVKEKICDDEYEES